MKPDPDGSIKVTGNKFIRSLLIIGGFLFSFLGILGAVLPLLPTTPFLLVAAACFYRSSPRFYNLLMNNRYFGGYLRDYREGRGVHWRVKSAAIGLLWLSAMVSIVFFVPFLWLKILVLAMVTAATVHISLIKTKKDQEPT
jgi:uncharacterized membrane protein YbaN (DUF454 family)